MFVSTFTGQNVSLIEPCPEHINIIDIAHGLAYQCRFNGQTSSFYSVAQHSLIVASLVPGHLRKAALLHDAAEAYVGDMVKNLKQLIPTFKEIEIKFDKAIEIALSVNFDDYTLIKQADNVALATEKRDLMPNATNEWSYLEGVVPMLKTIQPMDPITAKREFLAEYYRLSALAHAA